MIKITVLYNLPPGTDEDEFIRWRTTTHHEANISRPGVIRADFYRIIGTPLLGAARPASTNAPYRFITESYYDDYETFERSWNDPEEQARLMPAVDRITDSIFLISEEFQTFVAEE